MFVNMPEGCCEFTIEDLRECAKQRYGHMERWAVKEIERLQAIVDGAKPEAGYHAVFDDYCKTIPIVAEFNHLPTLEDRVQAMANDRKRLRAIVDGACMVNRGEAVVTYSWNSFAGRLGYYWSLRGSDAMQWAGDTVTDAWLAIGKTARAT